MTIELKLQKFLSGELRESNTLERDQVTKFAAISHKLFYPSLFFEEKSSVESNFNGPVSSRSFIGAFSYMNCDGYMRENVFIGRYCSLGRRITLGAGVHDMHRVSTSPNFSANRNGRPYSVEQLKLIRPFRSDKFTVINSDVWIGDGAIIMPGVSVGAGAVIGANSVVIRDVPPYSIYAGVPANLKGFRFDEKIIDDLLASQYWNQDPEVLQNLPGGNVFEFLEAYKSIQENLPHDFATYRMG